MDTHLRAATPEDALILWNLRNEETYRSMSLNTEPVPWDEHLAWFSKALIQPERHIYIVRHGGNDVGMLRLDTSVSGADSPPLALLSIALAPEFRGIGLGTAALRLGCHEAVRLGYPVVEAEIRAVNTPSIKAFQRAGFTLRRTEERADPQHPGKSIQLVQMRWTSGFGCERGR